MIVKTRRSSVVAAALLAAALGSAPSLAFAFATKAHRVATLTLHPSSVRLVVPRMRKDVTVEALVVEEPVVAAEPVAATPVSTPKEAAPPRLDAPAVRAAMVEAADSLLMCRAKGGLGPGTATVTADPEGRATVSLSAPYAGSAAGACIARRFARAAVPFEGEPFTLRVRFEL